MMNAHLLRRISCGFIKNDGIKRFTTGSIRLDSKISPVKESPAENQSSQTSQTSSSNTARLGPMMMKPSEFDKKLLVWVKAFPSKDKVPDRIKMETLSSAQTKARIKICNYMILITVIGFISAVVLGKRERAKGYDMTDILLKKNKPQ